MVQASGRKSQMLAPSFYSQFKHFPLSYFSVIYCMFSSTNCWVIIEFIGGKSDNIEGSTSSVTVCVCVYVWLCVHVCAWRGRGFNGCIHRVLLLHDQSEVARCHMFRAKRHAQPSEVLRKNPPQKQPSYLCHVTHHKCVCVGLLRDSCVNICPVLAAQCLTVHNDTRL